MKSDAMCFKQERALNILTATCVTQPRRWRQSQRISISTCLRVAPWKIFYYLFVCLFIYSFIHVFASLFKWLSPPAPAVLAAQGCGRSFTQSHQWNASRVLPLLLAAIHKHLAHSYFFLFSMKMFWVFFLTNSKKKKATCLLHCHPYVTWHLTDWLFFARRLACRWMPTHVRDDAPISLA